MDGVSKYYHNKNSLPDTCSFLYYILCLMLLGDHINWRNELKFHLKFKNTKMVIVEQRVVDLHTIISQNY